MIEKSSADHQPEEMSGRSAIYPLHPPVQPASQKACCIPPAAIWFYAAATFKYVFDYHPDDIYWCTADVGWVTGHSYLLYGPLACGATTLMFEGVPNWADASADGAGGG